MLDSIQIQSFRENGYLAVEDLISPEALRVLRDATDELLERSKALTATDDTFDVVAGPQGDRPAVVRRIFNAAQKHPAYEQVSVSPQVLDVVESLIGPNIEYHYGKMNTKPPHHDIEVGWHQDMCFFPHSNSDLVAVMIFLDDTTEDNGCITVVPGSHHLGLLNHFAGDTFIGMVTEDLSKVALSRLVRLPVRAGSVLFVHSLTLHGSAPNVTERMRRNLILGYRAADSLSLWPLDETEAIHYGKLVRGRRPGMIRCEERLYRIPRFAPAIVPRSLYDMQGEYRQRTGHQGQPVR